MNLVFGILAIICGAILLLGMDTGKLDKEGLAGIGIIFAALSAMLPADLSWLRR